MPLALTPFWLNLHLGSHFRKSAMSCSGEDKGMALLNQVTQFTFIMVTGDRQLGQETDQPMECLQVYRLLQGHIKPGAHIGVAMWYSQQMQVLPDCRPGVLSSCQVALILIDFAWMSPTSPSRTFAYPGYSLTWVQSLFVVLLGRLPPSLKPISAHIYTDSLGSPWISVFYQSLFWRSIHTGS